MRLTTTFLAQGGGHKGLVANTQANQEHQTRADSV